MTTENTFRGSYGLIIIPDRTTVKKAYDLAKNIVPSTAQFILDRASLPHITLYHAKFNGLPAQFVKTIRNRLDAQLNGIEFNLAELMYFGGNFLFWMIDRSSENYQVLQDAHEEALLAVRYLDRTQPAKSKDEEALKLSEIELKNIAEFGHPYVKELYAPHVTMGFDIGLENHVLREARDEYSMKVAKVDFVKMGFPGRVECIVGCET